jgi:hypothetical protein
LLAEAQITLTASVGTNPASNVIPDPPDLISRLLVVAEAPKLKYISASEMF